jgi:hypothetical protein
MHKIFMRRVAEIAALLLAAGVLPPRLAAQLVPDPSPPSAQPKSSAQTSSSTQTPSGKRRLSQEIQLAGDQLWSDTSWSLPRERSAIPMHRMTTVPKAARADSAI